MSKASMSKEDALIELQILLMDQQRSLDSLSDQLIAQADQILVLEKKVEWLQSRLTVIDEEPDQSQPTGDQRPPHY